MALPPRPDTTYGVFKVWGETMLRHYYDRYGIRSVSLRIGTFRAQPIDQRSLATWLSPADAARLVERPMSERDDNSAAILADRAHTARLIKDQRWFMAIFVVKVALGLVAFAIKPWLGLLFFAAYGVYFWREIRGGTSGDHDAH